MVVSTLILSIYYALKMTNAKGYHFALFVKFFFFVAIKEFEVTSSAVRDCTDVAKRPLGDKAECEKAASKLRLIYRGEVLPSDGSVYPKGCYSVWNNVLDAVWGIYWNGHKTGSQRKDCFPICYIDGKCTITYGFKVY